VLIFSGAREWRNGRRAGFRCQCPKGRGGSNPPSRTSGWGIPQPLGEPGTSGFPALRAPGTPPSVDREQLTCSPSGRTAGRAGWLKREGGTEILAGADQVMTHAVAGTGGIALGDPLVDDLMGLDQGREIG
jgi:hypothetical protein